MANLQSDAPLAVIGNEELMQRLERDVRAGQLSHAYILDGRAGSGRCQFFVSKSHFFSRACARGQDFHPFLQ